MPVSVNGYSTVYAGAGGPEVGGNIYSAQREQVQFARMVELQKLGLEKRRLNMQQAAMAAQQKNSDRDYNMAMMRFNLEKEKLDRDYEQSQWDREYKEREFKQFVEQKQRENDQWQQTYEQNERKMAQDQQQFEARQNQQQYQYDLGYDLDVAKMKMNQSQFDARLAEDQYQNDVRNELSEMGLRLQEKQQDSAEYRDLLRIEQTDKAQKLAERRQKFEEKNAKDNLDEKRMQRRLQEQEAVSKEQLELMRMGARPLKEDEEPEKDYFKYRDSDYKYWQVPIKEREKMQKTAPLQQGTINKALGPVDVTIERIKAEGVVPDWGDDVKVNPGKAMGKKDGMNDPKVKDSEFFIDPAKITKVKAERQKRKQDVVMFLENYKSKAYLDPNLMKVITPQMISQADWRTMPASKLKLLNDYLAAGKFDDDMRNAEMARLLKTNKK